MAAIGMMLSSAGAASAQLATDSSAQASPLLAPSKATATDSSVEASPLPGRASHSPVQIAAQTSIPLRLTQAIDSAHLRNGQTLLATLSTPVRTIGGAMLPTGTAVIVSVISTLQAGRISAAGEFSLQVLGVGGASIFSDVQTFRGQAGHKDLPDSAPALGTNAGLPAGAPLTFTVQPQAVMASGPPQAGSGPAPGSVNGVASGSPGTPRSSTGSTGQTGNSSGRAWTSSVVPTDHSAATTATFAKTPGAVNGIQPH